MSRLVIKLKTALFILTLALGSSQAFSNTSSIDFSSANSLAPSKLLSDSRLKPESLLKDSLTLSCIDYRLTGMCFWLKCSAFGCYIRTSPQVEHYNPDVLMEVTTTDKLPMKWLTGPIDTAASSLIQKLFKMSLGQRQKELQSKASYSFYDVNEIGNPVLPLYNRSVGTVVGGLVGWCGSQVTPFSPYFHTKVDPDWRLGLAEALLAIPNLTKTVGSLEDHWAPLYPRTGAIVHSDLYRGAAGAVFRAGHITTRGSQPHIYRQLPTGSTGGKTWGPDPLELDEGGSRPSNKWQLNYPRSKGSSCYQIPEQAKENQSGEYSTIESDVDNYVWTMWRKYKCCQNRGKFLYAVEW